RPVLGAGAGGVRDAPDPRQGRSRRMAAGRWVAPSALDSPPIPGLPPPSGSQEAYRLDFGPRFGDGIVTLEPPRVGRPFPVLVPRVDADGNDLAGVRIPEMAVPVATYTGWNLRDPKTGFAGHRISFAGSYVPF